MYREEIDHLIASEVHQINKVGLLKGDMGLCIFDFIVGKKQKDKARTHQANVLLGKILSYTSRITNMNISNGITGIALGISFLIKNEYVEGNVNEILEDVDCVVYKKTTKAITKGIAIDYVLDVLIYEMYRLKEIEDEDLKTLFKRHIGELLNYMYINRPTTFYSEPLPFSLKSAVCLYLIVLAIAYSWNIEKERILLILQEMKFTLFAQRPLLKLNRLWLMVVSLFVFSKTQDEEWKRYAESLKLKIDIKNILETELFDKCIFPFNGIIAIWFVLKFYAKIANNVDIAIDDKWIVTRIKESSVWNKFEKDLCFLEDNYSLDGYCGVKLFLDYIYNGTYEV